MVNYGQKISELRKLAGYTQGELGEKLNVTAQAVSKWEKGLSEPDLETINNICSLFNITANDFFGTEGETAVTETESAKSQPEKPANVAYCEKCHKSVVFGEYKIFTTEERKRSGPRHTVITHQHIYCNECFAKREQELENQRIAGIKQQRKDLAASTEKHLKRGIIWGSIALVVAVIVFIIAGLNKKHISDVAFSVIAVLGSYGFGALIAQCFWEGYVLDVLAFFCRSFSMPGVIFSLDLDGIIALIFVKITLSLLSLVLSLTIFLFGVGVAMVCSLFTFPFALRNAIKSKRNAVYQLSQPIK